MIHPEGEANQGFYLNAIETRVALVLILQLELGKSVLLAPLDAHKSVHSMGERKEGRRGQENFVHAHSAPRSVGSSSGPIICRGGS